MESEPIKIPHFYLEESEFTEVRSKVTRASLKFVVFVAAIVALFAQISVASAVSTTQVDIDYALHQGLGFSTSVEGTGTAAATPDQLRQAVAWALYNQVTLGHPAATTTTAGGIAATYVDELLPLKYPVPATGAAAIAGAYASRAAQVATIFNGAVQGMKAIGVSDAAAYSLAASTVAAYAPGGVSVFLPASGVTLAQTTASQTARAAIAGAVVAQLGTSVKIRLAPNNQVGTTTLNPLLTVAKDTAPLITKAIIEAYGALNDTRNGLVVESVLKNIPVISTVTGVDQAYRDGAVAAVASMLYTNSYMSSIDQFVAQVAKADSLAATTTTIQSFAYWIAANATQYNTLTTRVQFAKDVAAFGPRGSTTGPMSDAATALVAAGIAQASTGMGDAADYAGKVASAAASTLSDLDLASAALRLANPLDVRGGVILGGVAKANLSLAPDITKDYLIARAAERVGSGVVNPGHAFADDANAPAFAVAVTKALPIVVNPGNQTAFAGTTTSVTGVFVAGSVTVADNGFKAKTGVLREVVRSVATFADETVKEVALQIKSDLDNATVAVVYDPQVLAVNIVTAVAGNTLTSTAGSKPNVVDTTKALIASGVARAFPSQAAAVAQAAGELKLGTSTATATSTTTKDPTVASRAAIAAAVIKGVNGVSGASSVAEIVSAITSHSFPSLNPPFTTQADKISFGATLIPLLPATTGVPTPAKSIAIGLVSGLGLTLDSDKANIAGLFAGNTATTRLAANAALIAAGVTSTLSDQTGSMTSQVGQLAANVAFASNAAASFASVAGAVAAVANASAAGDIADKVAHLSLLVGTNHVESNTDAIKTAIASAITTAQETTAAAVVSKIAPLELLDTSRTTLATTVAKIIYKDYPSAVGAVAKNIAAVVNSNNTALIGTTGVTAADNARQAIARAALTANLPVLVNLTVPTLADQTNINTVDAVALSVAQNMADLLLSLGSLATNNAKANLANTLILAVPSYVSQTAVGGQSTVAGDIASSVTRSVQVGSANYDTNIAAIAKAATLGKTTQALNIATAIAYRGKGPTGLGLDDSTKAAVAGQVVLAAGGTLPAPGSPTTPAASVVTYAVAVANAMIATGLTGGDQSKADIASNIAVVAPTQAVNVVKAVATGATGINLLGSSNLTDAGLIKLSKGVVTALPTLNATTAGPVAQAAANYALDIATKDTIAGDAAHAKVTQAVDIAVKVSQSTGTTDAQKASIAHAVAAEIVAANNTASTTIGVAIMAKNVAATILPANYIGQPQKDIASGYIADIALQVANQVPSTNLTVIKSIASTVAANFAAPTSIPTAAPFIADKVAGVSGLSDLDQAAVAGAVALAVVAQAAPVISTVLNSSLIRNAALGSPLPLTTVATDFAQTIAASAALATQPATIAGAATKYFWQNSNPTTTVTSAGDIAVAVATAPNVSSAQVPLIATAVAMEIVSPTGGNRPNAVGGIADKFSTAPDSHATGNLAIAGYKTQVPLIATSLANAAYPTAHQNEQLAGIVAALVEALPYDVSTPANITATAGAIATIAKNVAQVAFTHYGIPATTTVSKDIVGYLVAELLARSGGVGITTSVTNGSFLYALRGLLAGTYIPMATINSALGLGTATTAVSGVATLDNRYTSVFVQYQSPGTNQYGKGAIGDFLSTTTLVTPFP